MLIHWLPPTLRTRSPRRFKSGMSSSELLEVRTLLSAAPILTLPSGDASYTENASAAIVASGATVTDIDTPALDGGNVTVSISLNAAVDDTLAIRNEGNAAGQIGVSGNTVFFGGTSIGTFTGGTGNTDLVVTLDADATPAAVEALVNNITFEASGDNPSPLARSVSFSVFDGTLGGQSTTEVRAVNILPLNDIPVIDVTTADAVYLGGSAAIVLSANATVADPDSINFDGGTLTVDASVNASLDNTLAIRNEGTGSGQIGVSGSDVTYEGTVIGTFTGGDGLTPLVVTFDADASVEAVQALVRNIQFSTTADALGLTTLRFVLTDGDGGTSASSTLNVDVVDNIAPVIDVTGPQINFSVGNTAVIVAPNGTVTDANSVNFDGGTLTVDVSANASADTTLAIRNEGTGTGQIGVTGSNVTYEGTVIGTFTGGNGLTPLVVTFDADATVDAVQALVRNINFTTTANALGLTTVRFVVTDGDGGTSIASTVVVNVTNITVNLPPIITPSVGTTTSTGGHTTIDSQIDLIDLDSPDFDGGTLTVTSSVERDQLRVNGQKNGPRRRTNEVIVDGEVIGTVTGGRGRDKNQLIFQFDADADPAAIEALMQSLTIRAKGKNLDHVVSFQISDGDGGTSDLETKTVIRT